MGESKRKIVKFVDYFFESTMNCDKIKESL